VTRLRLIQGGRRVFNQEVRMVVRLPGDLYRRLAAQARLEGRSRVLIVRQAVAEYLAVRNGTPRV
jgi:predicted transcriptional regulator